MSGVAHSVVYTRLVVFNPQITYKANGAHGHIPNSDLSPKTIVIKYRFNSRQYILLFRFILHVFIQIPQESCIELELILQVWINLGIGSWVFQGWSKIKLLLKMSQHILAKTVTHLFLVTYNNPQLGNGEDCALTCVNNNSAPRLRYSLKTHTKYKYPQS